MNNMPDDLYSRVIELFRSGDSQQGARLVDEEISKSPSSEESIHLRLIRAQALEFGGWGKPIDLQGARADYCELMAHRESLGVNVPLGLARTLYKLNHEAHITKVCELVQYVIKHEKNPHAYMLRGIATEEVVRDLRKARRDYWHAFTLGLPWGMRYMARSYWANHNYIKGTLAHCLATLSSPFLLWRHGPRGVLYEDFDREFYGTARRR